MDQTKSFCPAFKRFPRKTAEQLGGRKKPIEKE
jgi:hypothetical protein